MKTALAFALVVGAGCSSPAPTPDELYERAPWVLDAVTDAQMDVRVIHGCSRLAGVDAIESEDRVEVRAWVDPDDDDVCFLELKYDQGRVVLDAPLGTRELVGCMIEESPAPYDSREECGDIVGEQ